MKDELTGFWERARLGDQRAFNSLHSALYPGLYTYTFKMIKDEDLADDLLQNLFIKFWQNRGTIGSIGNVKAYFYRSTRFIVLNHIRSCQVLEAKLLRMPEPDLEFSKEEIIVSEEYDSEIKRMITGALNKLPHKQREIIYLRFYENLDYTQITEVTGIRYQSVVNHVYRAIQVMRTAFNVKNSIAC